MVRRVDEAFDETLRCGGGTFDLLTLDDVDAPVWAVGLRGLELPMDGPGLRDGFRLAYLQALKAQPSILEAGYRPAFGTWVDNGTMYCDSVALVEDRDDALALAVVFEQLAIYHLETGETITLEEEV